MGLLDFLPQLDEEKRYGLLMAAAQMMQNRQGLGPALGQGLQGGLLATQQFRQGRDADELRKMQLEQMKRQATGQQMEDDLGRRAFAEPKMYQPDPYEFDQMGQGTPPPQPFSTPGGGGLPEYMKGLYAIPGGPAKAIALQQAMAKDTPFGKIEPKDYTPDSVKAFMQAGGRDFSVLRPRAKMEVSGGAVYDPYAVTPGTQVTGPESQVIPDGKGGWKANPALMDLKNAGATRVQTNVNAFTPASEAAQTEFMKSSRATFDQLKQAPVALDSIEKAKALIPGARGFMGPGGEGLLQATKFLNNRLGMSIKTEGVKDAEELRTRIFFNIMDNLKKMDAQPSQQQQQIMQDALGKLGTDPNALPAVLDAFSDAIKGKVDLHNQEVTGAIQRGVKFPYDPIIKLGRPQQKLQPNLTATMKAKDAIKQGADPEAVKRRLRESGYDDSGL